MSKRLSDTAKWDKAWFRKLKPKYKCFWEYIRDKCDLIGLWEIDFESASFHIQEEITEAEVLKFFAGKLKKIGNKLLVVGFCHFQYGETLNLKSPIHKKVFDTLNKHTLYDTLYNRVVDSAEAKAEAKAKVKREVKEEDKSIISIVDYNKIKLMFNNTCTELKEILSINEVRKQKINNLIKEYKPDDVYAFFQIVFNKVKESEFLNGGGKNGFVMTFDWMLKPENFLKIIENNYQDEKPNNKKTRKQYSDDFKRKIAQGLQS